MDISRRSFIKASGGAATLGFMGLASSSGWLAPVSAVTDEKEKVAYTFHPPNCGGRCSFKCSVHDGKLVKIEPNDWPDNIHKKICLRGLGEVERVYSPDRLKTPLKRVGERGEGKFVAISWDEALKTVADKLLAIKGKYGGESILWTASTNVQYTMSSLAKLFGAQLNTNWGVDVVQACGALHVMGFAYAHFTNTNEYTDWVNSKMVILPGNNFLETTLTSAEHFFKAKEKGVKMVCIDPVYSTTAAKCNQWIPIRPGTDTALYLGMIHLILANRWYDEAYIRNYSSSPFLIREDNHTILRDGAKYLVWDENSDSAQPWDTPGIQPALAGEFTVKGVKVKTVFTALTEHTQQYTPSWASKVTKIPEKVIADLTQEYALGGPASLQWGLGGPDKWYHSDTTGRTATILAGLTGNIGRVGGGVGQGTQYATSWSVVSPLGAWELPPEFAPAQPEVSAVNEYTTKPTSVKALFLQGNILHQMIPSYNQTKEWVKDLEFIVVVDILQCDSVNFADIVLPACSSFESEYDIAYLANERNHILMQEKILEPLFDSKSDFQIEKELAKLWGLDQYLPQTPEDYNRALLSTSPVPDAFKGITIESLKANQCIRRLNVPNEPFVGNLDHVFPTDSTKLEFYNEIFLEENCPFPVWEEPNEASPSNPLYQKYPLMLGSPHDRFRAHSTFSNARWLLQINHLQYHTNLNNTEQKKASLSDDYNNYSKKMEIMPLL